MECKTSLNQVKTAVTSDSLSKEIFLFSWDVPEMFVSSEVRIGSFFNVHV